jgi:hypothetical protein
MIPKSVKRFSEKIPASNMSFPWSSDWRMLLKPREEAADLPPGKQRDALLLKARQHETASSIDRWMSSPGSGLPAPLVGSTKKVSQEPT